MKPLTRSVLPALLTLGIGVDHASAEVVFLADPTTATASTSFAGDLPNWGPARLYDANPVEADLETLFGTGSTQQYAGTGATPHVIVYDFGSAVTFNGVAYSQRAGASAALDKVQSIDIWVSDTDPGAATTDLPILSDPADANTGLLLTADTTFRNYTLGPDLTGRWVVFRLNPAGGGNTGGSELQLTLDTAPADPDLAAPGGFDFGIVAEDGSSLQGQFPISNVGATQTLNISGVTLTGGDAGSFAVTSFPATLAPGAAGQIVIDFTPQLGQTGLRSTTMVIASDDTNSAQTSVVLSVQVTAGVPAGLELLPDPNAITVSTFFDAGFAPEFLYDANLTAGDIETLNFDDQDPQYAGIGPGPHVIVLDYGSPVVFDGFVYAQRIGGNPALDKTPGLELWVTDTDPSAAALDLPILSNPADATVADLTTTDSILHYYPLGTTLTGRYVVIRLQQGNGNPGGTEFNLTRSGSLAELRITGVTYFEVGAVQGVQLTWDSVPGASYTVRRNPDLDIPFSQWEELTDEVQSGGAETTYQDDTLAQGTPRMFYKVMQN